MSHADEEAPLALSRRDLTLTTSIIYHLWPRGTVGFDQPSTQQILEPPRKRVTPAPRAVGAGTYGYEARA